MSVIVKGMEMPRDCNDCPCFEREWFDDDIVGFCKAVKVRIETYERLLNCPLIEIPTPHGRLIAAAELVRIWKGAMFSGDIKPIVDARPTVIKAEG